MLTTLYWKHALLSDGLSKSRFFPVQSIWCFTKCEHHSCSLPPTGLFKPRAPQTPTAQGRDAAERRGPARSLTASHLAGSGQCCGEAGLRSQSTSEGLSAEAELWARIKRQEDKVLRGSQGNPY